MGQVVEIIWDVTKYLCGCAKQEAGFICELEENLRSLESKWNKLEAMKKGVEAQIEEVEGIGEGQRTLEVGVWLQSIQNIEKEVKGNLTQGAQEIQNKCLSKCCPKNCKSSYKVGKNVAKILTEVDDLTAEGQRFGKDYPITQKNTMSSKEAVANCLGWAARDPSGVLSPYKFNRRTLGKDDVFIKITHCGVCYADVIWTRNKHGDSKYPLVPGHEIAGIVQNVGSNVHRFSVGDHVGVGTYVNSCQDCQYCNDGLEVHCVKGSVYTFNGVDVDGTITKGGYSSNIVVHERYCFLIPKSYPLASAAPLLCAGLTVYSPMMRHKMNQPGKSLGVIGLGGLGHMAVKFGKAFGLNVTIFSSSASKKEEAYSLLGADNFVVSSDQEQMKALAKSFDFIIDAASGDHPFDPYMSLLKVSGVLVLVGFPSEIKLSPASLNLGMRTISGSVTGGTKETQEMIDFCAANKIHPTIEVIPIEYINEALQRVINKDVKYRFVIDIEKSLK